MKQETQMQTLSVPWWRVRMVWLVISGPLAVVVAGVITIALALTHSDPVIAEVAAPSGKRAGAPNTATSPALQARNHAATPAR
jgi:uncharacterized protein